VKTQNGLIEADVVICTVHTWALQLLASLDWELPMQAVVHQRYLTAPLTAPVNIPAVNANPYEGYIRPAHGNRLLVGGETPERITFNVPSLNFRMDGLKAPEGLERVLYKAICQLTPRLKETKWASEQVGLLSFSMDEEPIVGEAPHVKNLFIGGAFHSGGFAYNPAAGVLLAELAADGETQIDISAFSPKRFGLDSTRNFLKQAHPKKKDGVSRRH
jgi:glycine/D-amino acid oxidase-like deaminating enzyme